MRSVLWVLLFIFSLCASWIFIKPSGICRIPGSSDSQSSVSTAVLFHCSGVPSHINGEAIFRVQQHEMLASLKIVLLKSIFLFERSLTLMFSLQAACHKERHVSRKAVSFIHDILTEVLTDWSEPSHFHFNESLFRPFERIMQLELCDEDVQDQASQPWLVYLYLTYCAHKKNGLHSTLGLWVSFPNSF